MNEVTEDEIYDMIDNCNDALENGSSFNGMSYEDGVKAALEWVNTGENPPLESAE